MTLEDFFTLSELKDGLTTPDRVKELITVMESEKDSVVYNSETTRQWSTVATTIAATENKNCLDLFINLDGPYFINKWLKNSQKLQNDNENGVVEELIIALLRALERLQIDKERLINSEIGKTVQDLGAHSSSTVREKSKLLCDSWMLIEDKNDETPKDVKNLESFSHDNTETSPPSDKRMDTVATNQEVLDRAEPSCKSTVDDEKNILIKSEVLSTKSETVEKSDVKDEEINFQDKGDLIEMSTLSSPLEQIASIADVDNPLQLSSRSTDVLSDKDEMVDDGESPKTSSNSEGDTEADNANGGIQINGNSENGSRFFKLSINSKTSDMELDYGMIDPLDIARQVANEVEREVDSRERSCSTSEKMSGGGTDKQSRKSTADSKNVLESQTPPVGESNKEISSGPVLEPVKDAETLVSQISEVAQESEPDTGRRFSGFDLNQDVCSEEVDNPVSSTISVVSASRAAAGTGSPAAPLQFEGTLGWKGSASTSAFPAIPEGSGTHNNSKQQSDFLDFDLNVADGSEDKMVIISGLPSGEESSVMIPRLPERPQLDLNSIWDDRIGWQSPSRSSSSSSKLPLKRNIDLNLNDQHISPNDASLDHSVISIFGKKVQVKKKDPFSEPKVDFSLGRPLESSMHYGNPNPDPSPSPSPSFYGHHNGMLFSMPMYGSSHSTPMQMPYMVDSRGAPFAPLVMPSQQPSPFIMNMIAAGPPHLQQNIDLNTGLMINGGNRETNGLRQFFPQNVDERYLRPNNSLHMPSQHPSPFIMNMTAAGPPHLQQNVDLNTGLMINGGNRETNGLRQFFPQNVDERYLRPNNSLQASSSSTVGGKRHEPDSRFDFFPVNKHTQPPWR